MEKHIPVLVDDVIGGLALTRDAVVFDCTFGSGGYAAALLTQLGPRGAYVGIDIDQSAIKGGESLAQHTVPVHLVCDNFRNIADIAKKLTLTPDAIVADLGWRSEQFSGSGKGFSFAIDEPLSMTFGDPEHYPFTAYDIANDWEASSISDIIFGYGEERFAHRIAHAIVAARAHGAIQTSGALAEIVRSAIPKAFRFGRIDPATKTFQALRIAVNDELGALRQLLTDGFDLLAPQGRLAIVSFHSLEDRIVKQHFAMLAHEGSGIIHTKKPIVASESERQHNNRARSAKLRIIEKTLP